MRIPCLLVTGGGYHRVVSEFQPDAEANVASMWMLLLFGAALWWGARSAHPAAWGMHAYAFLPVAVRVAAAVVLAIVLLPVTARMVGLFVLRGAAWVQGRRVLVLIVAGLCGVVFALARLRFQFLGDGQLWVDLISQDEAFHHFEPLSSWLVAELAQRIAPSDAGAAAGALSILCGVAFVFVSAGLSRALWSASLVAAFAWLLLLCNPTALLWFGYVESYPLVMVLQAGLAWALVQCVRGRWPLWSVVAWMAVANASHILTFGWWPVWIALVWWRLRSSTQATPRVRAVAWRVAVLCAATALVVLSLWLLMGVSLGEVFSRLGSERGVDSLQLSWFFSRAHALDMANELALLLAPALLLAVGAWLRGARAGAFPRTAEGATLLSLLPGPAATLLFVPPLLGGARDWDLYATVALPCIVWVVQLWSQLEADVASRSASRRQRRRGESSGRDGHAPTVLAGRVLGVALVWSAGWVLVPLDADRGARHFEALQDPRGTFRSFARAHGNEALGIYYRSRDARQEYAAWARATDADPFNPRYHINRANAALKLQRIEEAQHHFERALERGLHEWHVYYNLGVCGLQLQQPERAELRFSQLIDRYPDEWRGWGGRGEARLLLQRSEEALADLQQLVQMQPQSAHAYQLLGRAYRQLGRIDDARAAWRRALVLDPRDALSQRYLSEVAEP